MSRDTIYSGNISVLLAIIFFLALSSDMLASRDLDFLKDQFIVSARLLFIVSISCAISIFCLAFGEFFSETLNIKKILNRVAATFLTVQMAVLTAFTLDLVLMFLELFA